ncbi:MAG: TolC family protein [Candidatus Scalindua sp.]|nr:TolC family protein [Candidatus Scalindua sp.]
MALPVLDDNLNIIGVNSFDLQTSSQKFYQSNLRLIYSQPLLQNFKGTLDRLGMESSEISSDIADIQAIENQEDFLLINGLKFLDWVLLSEQKNIASERKELADLQYEQTVRKRESNLVDEIDVLRSKDAVLKADQIAMLITAQWKGLQAELAAIAQNPKILNSEPQFNLYSIVPLLTIEQGSKKLKSNSRLISALSKQQEIIGIQKIGSQELVKPQLYINSEIFLKNGDDSYNDALLPKETDYNLSLQLSFPMNNSSAKSRVAQNDLQVYQLELATQNVLLNLESALKNLLIQLEDFEQILEMNNLQIETARNKTDEELKRYNLGRGDLTFVIQSQDSEAQARLSYAQNAATYQALNLQVTALLDELLPQKIN